MKKVITFINTEDRKHFTLYDKKGETGEFKKGDVLELDMKLTGYRYCKVTKVTIVRSFLTEESEEFRKGFVNGEAVFEEERFDISVYVKPIK